MAYLLHDGLINNLVCIIVHAILEWHVHCVVLALAIANIIECTSAGEELPILVEAYLHSKSTEPARWAETAVTIHKPIPDNRALNC